MATEFFLGSRLQASYALEDVAWGTANTATLWGYLPWQKITPKNSWEPNKIRVMDDTDSRNAADHIAMVKRCGFTMETLIQHGRFFTFAWGADAVAAGGAGSAYHTHTIAEANTLPSFSLKAGYQHTTDFIEAFVGCNVNKQDIIINKGDYVRMVSDCTAQNVTKETTHKSYNTANHIKEYPLKGTGYLDPYMWHHASVTIDNDVYTHVERARLTIDNDLHAEPALGSQYIAEPIPQERNYSGSFTIPMATSALWDLWNAGAYPTNDMSLSLVKTADVDQIVFTITDPLIEVITNPHDVKGKVVMADLSFHAQSIIPLEINDIDQDYDTAAA